MSLSDKDSMLAAAFEAFHSAEERGIVYPYVRVRHEIAGTSPTINYTARLEKDVPQRGVTAETQAVTTTTTTTTV